MREESSRDYKGEDTMEKEIYELLNEKVNEVYAHFQSELGIDSGDISPE